MKKVLVLLLAVTMLNELSAQTYILDKVIARVGSELVLLSELEDQYSYLKANDANVTEDVKCDIMENLIAQKVIIYQAKLDSVDVSDSEVEAQLNYRFESILRQMNGDEEFFKDYYGATVVEMKERYREDQKQQILAERMQMSLINEVNITPKEVLEFYESIPSDSLPYLNSEVEVGEIIVVPQVNEEEAAKAREETQALRDRITEGGEDFGELARKYSDDPGSARNGGNLGFAKRGSYVPEFEAVAFSLKKDEISEVVETEYGFHVIQLLERRGNTINVRHILTKPTITNKDKEKSRQLLDSIKVLIESDSISFERAVKRFSLKSSESYNNNGRMKNPRTGNTFFETDALDPDIYLEILDLEPGDISNIIPFKSPTGEEMYRIVQLQSFTKPHKANLSEDYDKISLYAKESKKNAYFNDWVTKKMEETFIEVDPIYSGCTNLDEWTDKN